MPPRNKKSKRAPPVIDVDCIGALPDSILHHVLSFLPAQEAVQTCVLARRWRHLWRSTTGLRIDDDDHPDFQRLRKFVEHLLILRERTDLDTVDITISVALDDDVQHYVNLWIRFSMMCKVRVLTLDNWDRELYLDDLPVSRHLTTLHLDCVSLQETFLDFASCPALEDLKMENCSIWAGKISSRSLKHLSITDCWSDFHCRIRVSTPGLVSVKIDGFRGKIPFLENMVLLETAYIELDENCHDICLKYYSGALCGDNNNACKNCAPNNYDYSSYCVLLSGISSAKHLKLLSASSLFIFTRDLKHCPTFSKLKTLFLNEYWCESPHLDPLACILKNSPVLEKLTLQLCSEASDSSKVSRSVFSADLPPLAIQKCKT